MRPGGEVVLTAPVSASARDIEVFARKYSAWIARAVARMRHLIALPGAGKRGYRMHKEDARAVISESVEAWSARLGYRYGRIAIKDTARTWGSCSHRGNLNFSYKLLFLPEELREYVIVHELCHLQEANHSPRFWKLVEAAMPEYAARRKELRRYILR